MFVMETPAKSKNWTNKSQVNGKFGKWADDASFLRAPENWK